MHRVVDTVFCFIYKQKTVTAIGESKGNTKQTLGPITEASQWNSSTKIFEFYDRVSSNVPTYGLIITNHRGTIYVPIKRQT